MMDLSEHDWELVNAYHDGELDAAEARALESRLDTEPELAQALKDVGLVSNSLRGLRPLESEAPVPIPNEPLSKTGWMPGRWAGGGAIAATVALGIFLVMQPAGHDTVFDIHTDLTALDHAPDGSDLLMATTRGDVPDLTGANLTPITVKTVANGHVTHYAGRNGCRLSYFSSQGSLPEGALPERAQIASWTTGGSTRHLIIATGMDPAKFDAITTYLKLVTRRQSQESVLASLQEATTTAAPCVG